MAIRREAQVADRLLQVIRTHDRTERRQQGHQQDPIREGSALTRETALRLYECGLQSRLQDLEAR